ncbi:MAG: hypothetical protein OES57_17745, partial [Acidimicrobiia bacterium]|nr:hypothetical protein [Acidimicrobiia bacterium]
LDLIGLGDVVTRLDVLSTDAARAHRCRVVKLIGDEAMFVGAEPAQLVGAAWQFIDAIGGEDIDAHGAVTYGRVTMNQGDYFGPVVNLAARLVGHAGPGELLGNEAVAAEVAAEPAGTRDVRGLPDPVPVYRLSR